MKLADSGRFLKDDASSARNFRKIFQDNHFCGRFFQVNSFAARFLRDIHFLLDYYNVTIFLPASFSITNFCQINEKKTIILLETGNIKILLGKLPKLILLWGFLCKFTVQQHNANIACKVFSN